MNEDIDKNAKNNFIEKQSEFIDKLLMNDKYKSLQSTIKTIAIIIGIVLAVGFYFFSDYDYGSNYYNSNNSDSNNISVEKGSEE